MRNRCAPKAYVTFSINSKSVCSLSPLNANTIHVVYKFDPWSADSAVRANSDVCLFCVAAIPRAHYECDGECETHTHIYSPGRRCCLRKCRLRYNLDMRVCRPAYLFKDFVLCVCALLGNSPHISACLGRGARSPRLAPAVSLLLFATVGARGVCCLHFELARAVARQGSVGGSLGRDGGGIRRRAVLDHWAHD